MVERVISAAQEKIVRGREIYYVMKSTVTRN